MGLITQTSDIVMKQGIVMKNDYFYNCIGDNWDSWQVKLPFSIYIPEFTNIVDEVNGLVDWHDGRDIGSNFPDCSHYSILFGEYLTWRLSFCLDDEQLRNTEFHSILKGTVQRIAEHSGNDLRLHGNLIIDEGYKSFPAEGEQIYVMPITGFSFDFTSTLRGDSVYNMDSEVILNVY